MTPDSAESLEAQLEILQSKLQDAEQRLHQQDTILSSVSDAILTTDMEGRIQTWNRGAVRMYGWPEQEVLGKQVDNLLNRRHVGVTEEEVYEFFSKNHRWEGEMIHTTSNGEDIFVLCSINTMFDGNGHPTGLVGINKDISKQRAAQQAQLLSEERYRKLFDSFSDPIVIYDRNATIKMINLVGARNLGLRQEECIERSLKDFIPELYEITVERIAQVLKNNREFSVEDTILLPSGEQRTYWSIFHPIILTDGLETCVQITSYDITDRKQADQTILESQIRLQALFDHSRDAIMLLDGDGNYVDLNPATEVLTGFMRDDLIGKSFLTIVPKSHEQAVNALWARFGELGEVRAELQLWRKSEALVDVEFTAVKNILPGLHLAIVRDVTERRQAQKAEIQAEHLRAELEKEKELHTLKTRFFSMVAHDFRTPLSVISASVEMLERYRSKYTIDQVSMKHRQILQQVQLLSTLVNDVSTINKHDLVGHDFQRTPINIETLLEQIIKDVQLTYVHEARFKLDISPELLDVSVDKLLIQQILSNLLTNAIKYTQVELPLVTIHGRVEAENLILKIQDNGIGIPEKDQKYLFQVFHRASNVGNIPGNGLGLVIVKQAVEAHRGVIEFESEENKGTIFTVTLPLVDE